VSGYKKQAEPRLKDHKDNPDPAYGQSTISRKKIPPLYICGFFMKYRKNVEERSFCGIYVFVMLNSD